MKFENTHNFVQWNEEMSRKYDSESYHLRSNFLIRQIEKRRVQTILEMLNTQPTDTVVEVGCGAGIVLSQIPAKQVVGMDLSGYILRTKTRHRLQSHPALLAQANAEQLPLPSHTLTKIVCTEVIEHVQTPQKVVQELARVAQPNAQIIITIPNEALINRSKDWIRRLGLARFLLAGTHEADTYDSPDEDNEWHLHDFDLALLRQVITGILVIEKLKAIPFSFLPFRYVALCRVQSS